MSKRSPTTSQRALLPPPEPPLREMVSRVKEPVVTGIVIAIGSGPVGTGLVLVSPNTILDGTNALFFDHSLGEEYFFIELPRWAFLISAIVEVGVAVALILRRFARITI